MQNVGDSVEDLVNNDRERFGEASISAESLDLVS